MHGVLTWLSDLPFWLSAAVTVGIPTLLAMGLTAFVRHRAGLESLDANNEVAGFKYAVLGVVYAVLLGFAVSVVWEKFRDGDSAVMGEASAISSIYRLSAGLDPAAAAAIRAAEQNYGTLVLQQESSSEGAWPSEAVTDALSRLFSAVLAANPQTPEQAATFSAVLSALDTLSQDRRHRLELGVGTVPDVIWLVLFGGGLLNVAFMLFFGTRHALAQMAMSGMLTAVMCLALFAIIMIDHPFAGTVRVSLEPIAYVLEHMGNPP